MTMSGFSGKVFEDVGENSPDMKHKKLKIKRVGSKVHKQSKKILPYLKATDPSLYESKSKIGQIRTPLISKDVKLHMIEKVR